MINSALSNHLKGLKENGYAIPEWFVEPLVGRQVKYDSSNAAKVSE